MLVFKITRTFIISSNDSRACTLGIVMSIPEDLNAYIMRKITLIGLEKVVH